MPYGKRDNVCPTNIDIGALMCVTRFKHERVQAAKEMHVFFCANRYSILLATISLFKKSHTEAEDNNAKHTYLVQGIP